jgi:hypothetical protein
MLIISDTLSLVAMFYITVFIFKSRLTFLKILCVVCLLIAYSVTYIYFSQQYLQWLGVMQKVSLGVEIIWMLSVHYFAKSEDLQLSKA